MTGYDDMIPSRGPVELLCRFASEASAREFAAEVAGQVRPPDEYATWWRVDFSGDWPDIATGLEEMKPLADRYGGELDH